MDLTLCKVVFYHNKRGKGKFPPKDPLLGALTTCSGKHVGDNMHLQNEGKYYCTFLPTNLFKLFKKGTFCAEHFMKIGQQYCCLYYNADYI